MDWPRITRCEGCMPQALCPWARNVYWIYLTHTHNIHTLYILLSYNRLHMYHCPCFKKIFGSIFLYAWLYVYVYILINLHMCTHRVCLQSFCCCRKRWPMPRTWRASGLTANLNSRVPLRQGVWWMSLLYGFATKPPYFGFGLHTCLSCFFLKRGTFIANPVWWAPCFWWINRLLKASWQGRKSFKFGTKIPTPIFPSLFFPTWICSQFYGQRIKSWWQTLCRTRAGLYVECQAAAALLLFHPPQLEGVPCGCSLRWWLTPQACGILSRV